MKEMDELDQEFQESTPGVPMFLKVLCILTFVGSGLGIIGALMNMGMSGLTESSFEMMQAMDEGSGIWGDFGIDIEAMMRWQKYMNISNLLGSVLCLVGAFLMWKLKKVGYYVYVPGGVIPLVVNLIGVQYMMDGMMAGIGMAGVAVNGIVTIAFIIMYGLNFKHLK